MPVRLSALTKHGSSDRRAGTGPRLLLAAVLTIPLLVISQQLLIAQAASGAHVANPGAAPATLDGSDNDIFFGYVNVRTFGAKGDGKTDDTAAFKRAVASAPAGSTIFVPPGTYLITQDISYPATRSISWRGAGYGSFLSFNDSGLILTGGEKGTEKSLSIEALRIQRRGTDGPALSLDGATSTGLSRWALRDVQVVSDGGVGIYIRGAWIGRMDNVIVLRSSVGVHIEMGPENRKTSMNALTVTGGEVQGCRDGWRIEGVAALTMLGHAVEGNVRGITATRTPRGINIDGGYFEHNTAYDVSFEGPSAGYGNSIRDSTFFSPGGGRATPSSILLKIGKNFTVEGNSFIGYTASAVRVGDTVGTTTGSVQRNHLSSTPVELSNSGKAFGSN